MAPSLRVRSLKYVKNLRTCERSQKFMRRMLKPGVKPELVWTRLVRGSSTEYGTRWYYAMYLIQRLGLKPPAKRRCQGCKTLEKQYGYGWMKEKACWHPYYVEPKLLQKDFPWSKVGPKLIKQMEKEGL